MATPPSSGPGDPAAVLSPPTTSPNPQPPRTYISSMSSPLLPLPSHFSSQSILGRPPNPSPAPPQGVLYPIGGGATARGFPPRPGARPHPGDHHVVTVANPAGYIRNNCPTAVLTFPAAAVQARPLGFPADHAAQVYHHQRHRQHHGQLHQVRPLQQPQGQQASCPQFVIPRPVGGAGVSGFRTPDSAPSASASSAAAAAASKAVPVGAVHPKVTSFQAVTSNPESSNTKELRDKSKDDDVLLVSNRKVRLSESPSGSLYALCRSWVRNGLSQEIQPNFGDGIKLLPRPLPLKVAEPASLDKSTDEVEGGYTEKEDTADSVDKLSTADLLQRHVKRAKRVRARLREERLLRIERYKQRLSLLLPLPVEQCRGDAAPGS